MVVRFRRRVGVLIFALAAMLATAKLDLAVAEDPGVIPVRAPNGCIVGHRFEPGPIVKGYHRQPTAREFQARLQVLREFEQTDASRCARSLPGNRMATQPSPAG